MSAKIVDINQPKIENITWGKFAQDTRKLPGCIMGPKYSVILAVARGGLIPATILSHELNIRTIEYVTVKSYDHMVRGEQCVVESISATLFGLRNDILVVDDLVDTGRTFQTLRKYMPRATYISTYAKPVGKPHADSTIETFDQDIWLKFPWES